MYMRLKRAPALVGKTVVAFLVGAAVLVSTFFIEACNIERSGIYPGEVAPNIGGIDPSSGKHINLHDIPGDVVLVNFWATWCTPCMQELPALQRFYEEVKGQGISVVGIAVNDASPLVQEAVQRFGITFPILLDEDGRSKRKYELRGFPESFVLDKQHRVLVIPDPSTGQPVTKIVGPRDWAHPSTVAVFSNVYKEARNHDSDTH